MMSPMTTPQLLRIGEAAELVYGVNSMATRARLARMADRGQIRVVKIGERGDRWFAAAELDRLLAGELSDKRTAARDLAGGGPDAAA